MVSSAIDRHLAVNGSAPDGADRGPQPAAMIEGATDGGGFSLAGDEHAGAWEGGVHAASRYGDCEPWSSRRLASMVDRPTRARSPGPLVPMNFLLVLMVLLVIVLTYMTRHGGYGP